MHFHKYENTLKKHTYIHKYNMYEHLPCYSYTHFLNVSTRACINTYTSTCIHIHICAYACAERPPGKYSNTSTTHNFFCLLKPRRHHQRRRMHAAPLNTRDCIAGLRAATTDQKRVTPARTSTCTPATPARSRSGPPALTNRRSNAKTGHCGQKMCSVHFFAPLPNAQ